MSIFADDEEPTALERVLAAMNEVDHEAKSADYDFARAFFNRTGDDIAFGNLHDDQPTQEDQ